MTKASFWVALSLLVAPSSFAQLSYTEDQVIAYAKSIDVQTLDSSLPSQRLEDWLRSGPPRAHVYWRVADTCDLKPDDSDVDYPLCAKVTLTRDGENGEFLVRVGTHRSGIVGRPKLDYGIGVYEGVDLLTGSSERLSDLPTLLDQPAVTGGVQKLYEEIVNHHPTGVPLDAEMAAIRPWLSERLKEKLQTAQACQNDFRRQHAANGRIPAPSWLKAGIFSGDNFHASPVDALAVRKEKQNDGSFLIDVDLEPAEAVIARVDGRPTAFRGGYTWRVQVRVISESGQYVVDDVRIFDRFPAAGPSRLLSDSFSGCDGPLWIGQSATDK